MKFIILIALILINNCLLNGQDIDAIINLKEVERIERKLADDDMRGRQVFTPDIDKAANFIADEFKAIGMPMFGKSKSYGQDFALVEKKLISSTLTINEVKEVQFIVFTSQPKLIINQDSGYEKVFIKAGADLLKEATNHLRSNKNLLVFIDKSLGLKIRQITSLEKTPLNLFKKDNNIVFIFTDKTPERFTLEAVHEVKEHKLTNVVAELPGKSKKDEIVIFSAHYDHLGVGKEVNGDAIFNGANDDASGVTGIIMIAKYFKELKNNERTIIFVAFTAEEIGGFGSQYFSLQLDANKVMAMFNLEMIGTDSKWGKNSAYITGFDETNFGKIIMTNEVKAMGFTYYPDPYPEQMLFYRSDNETLALLGVPAHSISTSKMDKEVNYHQRTDHVETLDLENMTQVIKAIAISSKGIVSGKETPTRVKTKPVK